MTETLRETVNKQDMEKLCEHQERLDKLKAGEDVDYDFEVILDKIQQAVEERG